MPFSTLVVCLVLGLQAAGNPAQQTVSELDTSLAFSVEVNGHTFINKVRFISLQSYEGVVLTGRTSAGAGGLRAYSVEFQGFHWSAFSRPFHISSYRCNQEKHLAESVALSL